MSPRYLRGELDAKDTAAAALASAALAFGVGVVAFYFTRIMLSRESIGDEAEVGDQESLGHTPRRALTEDGG